MPAKRMQNHSLLLLKQSCYATRNTIQQENSRDKAYVWDCTSLGLQPFFLKACETTSAIRNSLSESKTLSSQTLSSPEQLESLVEFGFLISHLLSKKFCHSFSAVDQPSFTGKGWEVLSQSLHGLVGEVLQFQMHTRSRVCFFRKCTPKHLGRNQQY